MLYLLLKAFSALSDIRDRGIDDEQYIVMNNKLLVSSARWQQWSQISFATFI
jgi:hypothetical protein